jgi:hypothetical protein
MDGHGHDAKTREQGAHVPVGMRDTHQHTQERHAWKRACAVLEQRPAEGSAYRRQQDVLTRFGMSHVYPEDNMTQVVCLTRTMTLVANSFSRGQQTDKLAFQAPAEPESCLFLNSPPVSTIVPSGAISAVEPMGLKAQELCSCLVTTGRGVLPVPHHGRDGKKRGISSRESTSFSRIGLGAL